MKRLILLAALALAGCGDNPRTGDFIRFQPLAVCQGVQIGKARDGRLMTITSDGLSSYVAPGVTIAEFCHGQ